MTYANNTNAGTATASATFGGDANHTGSSDSKSFTIGQASSTTTVTCPASVTYTGAALTPCSATVTGAGGLNQAVTVTYANNTNAGTATASATFGGDANHTGSSDSKSFTIGQASSTTTVTCPASVTYTGAALTPCSATVTGAGGLNQAVTVTYANNTNAGTATASATFGGDANHTGSSDSKSFTIGQASSTTTVTCPASVTYTGAALTPCSATVTGAGGLDQAVTVTYANNTNVGTAVASATYAGDANHTGSTGTKTFAITKGIIRAEYTGDWFVASGTSPSFRVSVLPAIGLGGAAIDFSKDTVTATFKVFPAGCSNSSCPAAIYTSPAVPVTNGPDWTPQNGHGVASVAGPTALPDDAFVVTVDLAVNGNVTGERAVAALAVHPGNSTYVVGGGNLSEGVDPNANDDKGFFGFNVKKARNSAIGSLAYVYRIRINPAVGATATCTDLGTTCRDVDVIVRSTSLDSASTTQSSTWPVTGTAVGSAMIQFVDAINPATTYNFAPQKPTFRYDAYDASPGSVGDTFGLTVYTTTGKTTTSYHEAASGPTTQSGTGVPTNMAQIGGVGADISAPPGNR